MRNVIANVVNNTLTLTIDLSQPGTPSASGKSLVIGSTCGNVTIPGTKVSVGLNVYTSAK